MSGATSVGDMPLLWEASGEASPVVAVAVHAGHDLRDEVAELCGLGEEVRLLEEDPGTDVIARAATRRGIATRSRFEVDLNRVRHEAVYVAPEDAWGLDLWHRRPERALIDRSLALHDRFYRELAGVVERTIAAFGTAVVLDVHSYNHRRSGEPEPADKNPQANVGTGSLDHDLWGALKDGLIDDLRAADLDARENVRFKGRAVAEFINTTFAGSACCFALDFKKTYMDETAGTIDLPALYGLRAALQSTIPGLERALGISVRRAS